MSTIETGIDSGKSKVNFYVKTDVIVGLYSSRQHSATEIRRYCRSSSSSRGDIFIFHWLYLQIGLLFTTPAWTIKPCTQTQSRRSCPTVPQNFIIHVPKLSCIRLGDISFWSRRIPHDANQALRLQSCFVYMAFFVIIRAYELIFVNLRCLLPYDVRLYVPYHCNIVQCGSDVCTPKAIKYKLILIGLLILVSALILTLKQILFTIIQDHLFRSQWHWEASYILPCNNLGLIWLNVPKIQQPKG